MREIFNKFFLGRNQPQPPHEDDPIEKEHGGIASSEIIPSPNGVGFYVMHHLDPKIPVISDEFKKVLLDGAYTYEDRQELESIIDQINKKGREGE